ncbi:MAG: hypothetical protein Q7O66_05410 [Dehalococcoidia bacterium]|nr:hypothetical protein [Dehalococcoidia bacterium]
MSWFDELLGRQKPVKSQLDHLFAMSTAYVTLQAHLGLRSTGKASVCIKPVDSSFFEAAAGEINDLLRLGGQEVGTKAEHRHDSYGYEWLVLTDGGFEDLVAAMHVVSTTLDERGFGEQMLAAVFQFENETSQSFSGKDRLVYWLYNYKRGKFYPFVPLSGHKRDNAFELRLGAIMEKELPIEAEMERWYPLWDMPLSRE